MDARDRFTTLQEVDKTCRILQSHAMLAWTIRNIVFFSLMKQSSFLFKATSCHFSVMVFKSFDDCGVAEENS